MNTFTNGTVRTLGLAFAALVLLALPFVLAPKAHAADLFDGGDYSYDTFVPDYSYDNGYSYDTFVPDYSYDNGYSYDTFVPDNSYSDYGYSDYGSSGYGYGGSSYLPSSFYQPYQPAGNVNQNTNVNQNYCTNGSCNTSSSVNAPTTIITNNSGGGGSYPVYMPSQPVYQPTYQPYQQPIAYNNRPAPYVSLSAVPYTGLDLGPWGTAAYWGFLILWCLGAAYLIVVKRVQNKLVSALNGFLFGTTKTTHTVAHSAPVVKYSAPAAPQFSGIDPFIASQISRAAF